MSQHARQAVERILESSSVGTMATIKNNRPHTRFMTFFHKDLTLYTATTKETDKVEEIEQNPHTHILIGYDGEGYGDEYIDYHGKVAINDSDELKKQLWTEKMEPWFEGPDDPNYIILEIKPETVRLMTNQVGNEPQEVDLA
ncbi:pyridoxamine 5'-phosphate oxidase family protein [Ornithinibacillus halophilus]|uniref:General stress protein 26 n=1 Tax=Ornithinibacillus halophilus TaxID=930117 RepID=A0A1M5KAZ2_9BACI|nr:General stress protein 26 [Ornithinibacillus halophilus]